MRVSSDKVPAAKLLLRHTKRTRGYAATGSGEVKGLVTDLPRALWAPGNDAVVTEDGPTLRSWSNRRAPRVPGSSSLAVPLTPVMSGPRRTTADNTSPAVPAPLTPVPQLANPLDLALGAGGRFVQATIGTPPGRADRVSLGENQGQP
jgi:hypothetical protein